MNSRRFLVTALAVVVATGIVAGAVLRTGPALCKETTEAAMRGIFNALTTAYGYSLDLDAFEDPANHARIKKSLVALAQAADRLERHGGGLDPSFDYLRRSLAKDAHDALDRYEQRQYLGAKFLLTKLTENCVTCHSRVASGKTFDVGSRFVEDANVQKMSPVDRVSLEIATRQFDKALDTYEEIFRMPTMTASGLALMGAFEGYLKICIGVVEDGDRAIRTLKRFKKRADMGSNTKQLVDEWIAALEKVDLDESAGKELETARALVKGAQVQKRFPSDRTHLVDFIVASTLLHRYFRTGPTDDDEMAEAYYMLAVAESHVSRSYWISETEFLLEKSIRQAPKSPYARKAYAFLEEYTTGGYVGAGSDVPDEVKAHLDELRQLIEE